MRTAIAAFSVALFFLVSTAPVAPAAPAEVNVRIEGRSETLFEGPILTDGHNVKASSDKGAPAAGRRCNGLNNGQNPTPGPTPTAASVDAMSILGQGFDGRWYAEPFEDYFITRWGNEAQDEGNGAFWGLLVNNVFTGVGGCQYQLDGGDEVLWVYDAFKDRPRLALYPASYSGGARPLTATAGLNVPFEVEVDAWQGYAEGDPPAAPQRTGSQPFEGAAVAPVTAGPGGFETVDAGSPETVETDADGGATITFDEPGWQRIKATVLGAGGAENAVRSNRLDVCVPDPPANDCGPPPADDEVRVPPPSEPEEEPEEPQPEGEGPGTGPGAAPARQGVAAPADPGRVRLKLSRLDRSALAQGLVKVSWRVLDPGAGISRWTISSQALGRDDARYVTRARGTGGTSASLRLPPAAAYRLRITVIDVLGRSSSASLGRVRVPA
jgi:hypothetical protein